MSVEQVGSLSELEHQLYTIYLFDGHEKGWRQLTYLPLWKQRQ